MAAHRTAPSAPTHASHRTRQHNGPTDASDTAGHAETSCRAVSRTTSHAVDISTLRGTNECTFVRAYCSALVPSIATASCASAEQAQLAPVRDRVAQRGASLAGRAGKASEMGSPRKRWSAIYAPKSSTLHHLALGTANCDTGVPTVRAHLGAGMQIVETYPRTPRAMVSCPLRQPEMKMLGCERYTQLRMRAGEPCRPFVASHTEDQTPVDAPTLHQSCCSIFKNSAQRQHTLQYLL